MSVGKFFHKPKELARGQGAAKVRDILDFDTDAPFPGQNRPGRKFVTIRVSGRDETPDVDSCYLRDPIFTFVSDFSRSLLPGIAIRVVAYF
jgi:hypothetical protein